MVRVPAFLFTKPTPLPHNSGVGLFMVASQKISVCYLRVNLLELDTTRSYPRCTARKSITPNRSNTIRNGYFCQRCTFLKSLKAYRSNTIRNGYLCQGSAINKSSTPNRSNTCSLYFFGDDSLCHIPITVCNGASSLIK